MARAPEAAPPAASAPPGWREEGIWPLVSAACMQRLDRHTIETLGVPGELLMESAGRSLAARAARLRRPGARVWLACGTGNNGGDGLVAARHLHLEGVPVRVVCLGEPEKLRGEAARNRDRARACGVPLAALAEQPWRPEPGALQVDALFGTGLSRPLEGEAAELVRCLDRLRARDDATRTLAVDLPSGLDADTGQPLGVALHADLTLTLSLPKLGLALEPGRSHAGRIVVARIGIADAAPGQLPEAGLYTRRGAGRRLPARHAAGHKGSFGHVLVVAGSEGKSGAAALGAEGAARVGAGLVTIACAASLNPVLEAKCTEAMTAPLPELAGGALGLDAEKALLELAAERDVVALGPGLGRRDETQALVRRLVAGIERPLVLDADGFVACAEAPEALRERAGATILTPHPGEAARMLGGSSGDVNADRIGAARELAARSGAIAVLKGSGTVVAAPDGALFVNPTGGPLLAAGGSGDVLTGVIAGLLAQGMPALEAAAVGVYLHGFAADRRAAAIGDAGLLASELAAALPAAQRALREAAREPSAGGEADALAFPEPG